MPNPYFAFKQFTIYHDQCAMKVNTDGCLLGAWAQHDSPNHVLDIGAGSGVISLMLAQRYESAQIHAVELEQDCASQCNQNFGASPFAARLQVHHKAIQSFESGQFYNLIVSNPPYFQNDTPALGRGRLHARHGTKLSLLELFQIAAKFLSDDGNFCIILPYHRLDQIMQVAAICHLHLVEQINLRPLPIKPIHRVMLSFSKHKTEPKQEEVEIESVRGLYSPTVTEWLKPFYLNL